MKKMLSAAGVLAALMLAAPAADAAAYLKLGDIKGEATDSNHRDWISINSASLSLTTDRKTKPVFSITKQIDKSTPLLMQALVESSSHPAQLVFTRRCGDGQQVPYLSYELTNALISSYALSGTGDEALTEDFSLNFEKIKVTYSSITDKCTAGPGTSYDWQLGGKR